MAVTLQGWPSLWGGLQSELRLCYLLKQQAHAAMSQGSFLPAWLLLGNCSNQEGLLIHLQQSGSLVPKSLIVRAVQSGPDWSIRCLGQGWNLKRSRACPCLSALTWVLFLDIMLFWIEANSLRLDGSLWMSVLELTQISKSEVFSVRLTRRHCFLPRCSEKCRPLITYL